MTLVSLPNVCSPRGSCFHTLNICLTFCRGRLTLSLCRSCRTSLMLKLPSPFLSASVKVCFSHVRAVGLRKVETLSTNTFISSLTVRHVSLSVWENRRILISGPLPLGQAVLVTDPSHQVFEPRDPSPGLLSSPWDQVQGLHVLPIVQTEAAVWVKAAFGVTLEDLRLLPLTHLTDGVDGNYQEKTKSASERRST